MHHVKTDPLKNRLYITINDWDQTELPRYFQKIEIACKQLVPGFTCLTVLKKKGFIDQQDSDLLFSTTDLVSAYGGSKIVHIRKVNGYSDTHWPSPTNFQTYIPVEFAANVKDAENILNGNPLRQKAVPASHYN
jgi:hypothetical protein